MITEERLKQFLTYNHENGTFFWIQSRRGHGAFRIAGNQNSRGYWRIKIDGKEYRAARLAWLYIYGVLPSLVDHINRDPSDNRISNLRIATDSQNQANRKVNKNSKTGLKGVVPLGDGKFCARIQKDKRIVHLGTFNTAVDAHEVYRLAALKMHGEFACVSS